MEKEFNEQEIKSCLFSSFFKSQLSFIGYWNNNDNRNLASHLKKCEMCHNWPLSYIEEILSNKNKKEESIFHLKRVSLREEFERIVDKCFPTEKRHHYTCIY